jgi:hypothetical protein
MDGDLRGAAAGTTRAGARNEGRPQAGRGGAETAPNGYGLPAHDVRALTRGGNQATLVLDGVAYSLRITRAGKLILTK